MLHKLCTQICSWNFIICPRLEKNIWHKSCQGQIKHFNLSLAPFVSLSMLNSRLFRRVHGMHAMRVTNFPHLNHLKEIYLASISSNRCSASSHSKSKIKKPIRKMPKPRIFPRFCKCWNLKKKEKGENLRERPSRRLAVTQKLAVIQTYAIWIYAIWVKYHW